MTAETQPLAVSGVTRDREAGRPIESIEAISEQAEP